MTAARKQDGPDSWLSLQQAATALGVGKFAALSMIARGELEGSTRGRYTFVRRDSVDALIAARSQSTSAA